MPSPDTVRALCKLYKAPADVRRELVELAEATHGGNITADSVRNEGGWQMQRRVGLVERSATSITSWNCTRVDGICQTADYTRSLFGEDYLSAEDLERTVAERQQRQDALTEPGRTWRIVHTESALSWCIGSPAVMVAQMDRLVKLASLPGVQLGGVPFGTAATVPALHDFTIYNDSTVHYGTGHLTLFLSEQAYVRRYQDYWSEFEPLIVWGDAALDMVERVRARYAAL